MDHYSVERPCKVDRKLHICERYTSVEVSVGAVFVKALKLIICLRENQIGELRIKQLFDDVFIKSWIPLAEIHVNRNCLCIDMFILKVYFVKKFNLLFKRLLLTLKL